MDNENKWEYDYSSANSSSGETGYPNVGSSGMNTANTAGTYGESSPAADPEPASAGGNGGATPPPADPAPRAENAKPAKKPRKKNGAKVARSAVALVLAAAMGFAGGFVGARFGNAGSKVVIQQVERSSDPSSGSAAGTTVSSNGMTTAQVAEMVSPSVVVITTEQVVYSQWSWYGQSQVESGAGSGVIISSDGYILTCAHVVSGATSVKVQLNGSDESYDATVVGQDPTSDIAVLKINATGLTPAVIGDSDALAVGEVAVAVGNPLGTLSNTVTDGIVSALNRQVTVQNNDMTLIQTDASISPGNSGGGLFNGNGELIGIVNAKSSYSEAEGIGFAIPINTAMEIGQQLIESGAVARPALGIKILDVTDSQTAQQLGVTTMGVYVVEVTKGSGAEAAGLQVGDRVLAVDDTAVSDSSALKNYLKDKAIGDKVNLQVEREGKVLTLEVTLSSSVS